MVRRDDCALNRVKESVKRSSNRLLSHASTDNEMREVYHLAIGVEVVPIISLWVTLGPVKFADDKGPLRGCDQKPSNVPAVLTGVLWCRAI